MSTSAITRQSVISYTVKKKKINKNIEGDTLKMEFSTLPRARAYAIDLWNRGNFKSLTNSNNVSLPMK
jgi:hypothetical protein